LTARRTGARSSRGAQGARPQLDVLAVGAHPDDVELGCGGTLALLARAGRAVGIVHLTSGEAGSRGTAADRRREAAAAARALGVGTLEILDCGDAGLRTGRAEEDALIEVLRRLRPRLVLGPPAADRHPDHGRAHALLRDACFYAGLAKRSPERGAPHRPAALYCYLQHDLAVPTFVVDVTAAWARKVEALDAYASQLWREGAPRAERARQRGKAPAAALTFVSSPEFRLSIEARARHLGVGIGATYGEGFLALGPLAVTDPLDLVPGGLT
jgi:bacillithiol biosynthesis deacetylase BshB1